MADTLTDVLVCGHQDMETAEKDFETLISRVQAKEVRIQAVILISHDEDGSGAAFAIVDAATDQLLGAVSRFGPDGHQATLGCWVAREARGRGVGTRSLRAVADWTLATSAVIRLDAYIMVGNETSERMTERAGFQREGILRAWDLLRGAPVDCVVYSLLRSDGETAPV